MEVAKQAVQRVLCPVTSSIVSHIYLKITEPIKLSQYRCTVLLSLVWLTRSAGTARNSWYNRWCAWKGKACRPLFSSEILSIENKMAIQTEWLVQVKLLHKRWLHIPASTCKNVHSNFHLELYLTHIRSTAISLQFEICNF